MRPDGESWDYHWSAEMPTGMVIDGRDRPQSFARGLGQIDALVVYGKDLSVAHRIAIPDGALPAIVQFHGMVATMGGDDLRDAPREYGFGWEKNGERHLWLFGSGNVKYETRKTNA